ncbi:MAG: cyclic nucleotide-binding domain-containing protein [Anaerolineales bacterium]|uniref:cyclic nucleotide-binding domain-containing protein n=1 Tax=Candidatus Villigracilis proximus TaxID=3140683 RepID=UPI003136D60E|nr:cyclic nucleotide-binding domain-containing protein [Anaerolineales bacterium]
MNNLVNFLKQSDIFYQFTPTQLELVANLCQEVVFNVGEVVFQENSGSKELYVIAQGEVDILIHRNASGDNDKKRNCGSPTSPGSIFW